MKTIKSLSIKNKLILMILSVTMVALILGFAITIIANIGIYKNSLVNISTLTAQLTGENILTAVTFYDRKGAEDILSKLKTISYIEYGCMLDNKGVLFAEYNRYNKKILHHIEHKELYKFTTGYLHVHQPVIYNKQDYGEIYLLVSTAPVDRQINKYIATMLLLIAGLLILSYILALKFQTIISKPVLYLAGVTEQISKNEDYSIRVVSPGSDEISTLYDGFNTMLDQIMVRQIQRDRAETSLRDSEERFRRLAENARDLIYRMSLPDGRYEYVSPASLELTGYSPDEFYGSPKLIRDIIHPSCKKYFAEEWSKLLAGNMSPTYEYKITHKSGEPRWLYQKNVLIRDKLGYPIALESIVSDITGIKNTEESMHIQHNLAIALSKTNDFIKALSTIIEAATDIEDLDCGGIYFTDNSGRFNLAYSKGFSSEFVRDLDHISRNSTFIKNLESGIPVFFNSQDAETDSDINYINSIKSKEGLRVISLYPVLHLNELTACIIIASHKVSRISENKNNILEAIASQLGGITARLQAEVELRKTKSYVDNIINSMPSTIIGLTPEAVITHWNLQAERYSGMKVDKAIGRNLLEIIPAYSVYLDEIKTAIKDRMPMVKEKVPVDFQGNTYFSDMVIYPLITNGIEGAVLRIDDVTEKVRMQELMVQTEKMMTVGGLAAGMAHEINNPLGIILQGIQNTMRRLSPALEKNNEVARQCGTSLEAIESYMNRRGIIKYLEGIHEAGKRAARIVTNMLNFSRISHSQMLPTDINSLLDDSIELASNDYDLRKKYDFRRVEIIRDYDKTIGKILCTDTEIEQVILNLLKNSAQAMHEVNYENYIPRITIRTRKRDEFAEIYIEDNGPGMDESIRRHIFEPFFTTKKVGDGTGLGLSVSYFIITNNHRGIFNVDSIPGKGTAFTVLLPLLNTV